jgi:hypothetical protein
MVMKTADRHKLNMMKAKPSTPKKTNKGKQAGENPFFRHQKFWLPGDVPNFPKPQSLDDLMKQVIESDFMMLKSKRKNMDKVRCAYVASAIEHLAQWLFLSAMNGDEVSQRYFFDSTRFLTVRFMDLLRAKFPAVKRKAWASPDMPGLISLLPDCQTEMKKLCVENEQGRYHPLLMKGGQGNPKMRTSSPQNMLVEKLWGWMDVRRRQWGEWTFLQDEKHGWIHPLELEIVRLPVFTPDTVEKWMSLSWKVLEDTAGGDLNNHPAFKPGGEYSEFLNAGGKSPKEKLRKAWRERSKFLLPDGKMPEVKA